MTRRDLKNTLEERARLAAAEINRVIYALAIPTSRYSGSEQGFDFRSEIKYSLVKRVKKRFDSKPVTGCKDSFVDVVPDYQGELAAQLAQAVGTEFLIEMQGNFAVRAGAEAVPPAF